MKNLERAANVAVIIGVIVFLFVEGQNYLRPRSERIATPAELVGKKVTLPGVQFDTSRQSLILAVSTTCHFCKQEMPFYKQLSSQSNGKTVIFAALPQPQAEGIGFMEEAAVPAAHVVSADLSNIGVRATPTLLLVDGTGTVQHAWVGVPNDKARQEILSDVERQ